MKIQFRHLAEIQPIKKATIHSLELSLYSLSVQVGEEQKWVLDERGEVLTRHSVAQMREVIETLAVDELVLRQQSAYDEMVGMSHAHGNNTMELTLARDLKPVARSLN